MTPHERTDWLWQELAEVAYLNYPDNPAQQRAWITGFLLSQVRASIRYDSLNHTRLVRALEAAEQRASQLNRRLQ